MKTKILIFTFFTVAISCNLIKAQQISGLNIPNVAIHSPEVNGLGQYGDYLVDPSTGVVPVNIPLYTIKTAKLPQLPLFFAVLGPNVFPYTHVPTSIKPKRVREIHR